MKRNIAIVAGGDTSEIVVYLRSAQGIYSFIDKEKYNLYIVEMEGRRWEVQLPDGNKVPVDRNDFSFMNGTEKVVFQKCQFPILTESPGHRMIQKIRLQDSHLSLPGDPGKRRDHLLA